MKKEEFLLNSKFDGLPISVLLMWDDRGVPIKGVFELVHGMCEYKERYIPFMEFIVENGYVCVIHDHRGHGDSIHREDDLGYFYEGGYNAMIEDVMLVRDNIMGREEFVGLPIHLFGHSMGSMVVRGVVKRYDDKFNSLIVCGSPSYNPLSGLGVSIASMISWIKGKRYRSEFVHRLSFGGFKTKTKGLANKASKMNMTKKMKMVNSWICSDTSVVKAYNLDHKCHFRFTLNGFVNLFRLMKYVYSPKNWKLSNLSIPIHFISGADDACLVSEDKFLKAVDFMRKRGYSNVSSKLYPNMRHEILNEIGKEEVYVDILNWLGE